MRFITCLIFVMSMLFNFGVWASGGSCKGKAVIGISREECGKCSGYFYVEDPTQGIGGCISCSIDKEIPGIQKEECMRCPNRIMVGDYCVSKCPDGQIHGGADGTCTDCSYEYGIEGISSDECAACANRKMLNGVCVLKSCGLNKFADTGGSCHSCSYEDPWIKATDEECSKCPNRKMSGGKCIISDCGQGQYRDNHGLCHSCSGKAATFSSVEECSKCPDRKMSGGKCILSECGQDHFRNNKLDCLPCSISRDDHRIIDAPAEECAKCPNRRSVGLNCIDDCKQEEKRLCVNACEQGEFLGRKYNEGPLYRCLSCSDKSEVKTTKAECAKCPGREMKGDDCVLSASLPQQTLSPKEFSKVVSNPNKKENLPVCGASSLSEACLFYVQNNYGEKHVSEDFFRFVGEKTQRMLFYIRRENQGYERQIIPPGYFAEIIVPAF